MKRIFFWLIPCLLIPFFGCNQDSSFSRSRPSAAPAPEQAAPPAPPQEPGMTYDRAENSPADAAAEEPNVFDPFHSAAATMSVADTLKKFIRTADVRFRTPDALRATLEIENLVQRHSGFVTSDNLLTEIEYRQTHPINRDSALETTRYTRHAQLVLRVPYHRLDTMLRDLGHLAEFFDHRRVQAEDISFRLLDEQLAQARQQIHQQQVRRLLDDPGRKRENIMEAADRMLESRTAEDRARVERLKIEDAVRYSTLSLDVYEQPRISQVRVANLDVATSGPSFGVRAAEALRTGWALLESLFIGILNLWSLFLLGGLVYFLVKKYGRGRVGFSRSRTVVKDPTTP